MFSAVWILGTHSLQRDVMLDFSKSVLMKKQTIAEGTFKKKKIISGLYIPLTQELSRNY